MNIITHNFSKERISWISEDYGSVLSFLTAVPKRVINQSWLSRNNGIPNKFPVRADVGTKNAFTAVRCVLTSVFLSRSHFVQENVVSHNSGSLRAKDASFPTINLHSAVMYLLR